MFGKLIIGSLFILPLMVTPVNAGNALHLEKAIFAGGCFWCMVPPFEKLDGVSEVISGYTGGHKVNPTYEEVSSGTTGHMEAVEVTYDPARVSYEKLLDVFWRQINPTDAGGQFVVRGSSYKSAIFYNNEDKEATVRPFRSLSPLKFRLSVDNPLLKTLAGQRINQTDMGYFIKFLLKNLRSVEQKENEFREDGDRVEFLFWALDYIEEKSPEKYRISISKKHWLPLQIERFNLEDKRLEVTDIKNYVLNGHLEDKFFLP